MRKEGDILPLGLRITIVFVQIVMVVTFFPTIGLVVTTLIHLTQGPFSKRPTIEALLESLALMTATVIFSVMLAGGSWLDATLSQRGKARVEGEAARPVREFFLPLLAGVAIYGGLAILLWLLSLWETSISKSWPWPLVWGIIGGGAYFFHRHLDRTLPR